MTFLFLLFPVTLLLGWAAYPHRRHALRRRARRVSDAPVGEWTRVVGHVRHIEPALASPLTGRPCAAFRVLVQRDRRHRNVRVELDRAQATRFVLEDASGELLVDCAAATIYLEGRAEKRLLRCLPSRFATALPDDARTRRLLHDDHHDHEVRESVVLLGDRVTVVGRVTTELDPATLCERHFDGRATYRRAAARALPKPRYRRVLQAELLADQR